MRISDWSSVVCSSHLCAPSSWPPIYGRFSSSPSWQTSSQLSSWPCDGSSSVGLTGTAAQLKPSRESDPRQTADAPGAPDRILMPPPHRGAGAAGNKKPASRGGAGRRVLGRCQVSRKSRSEEHTSELQSLMRTSYAVFCLKKNNTTK